MTTKPKKLTVTELEKLDSQINKKQKILILDGKYEVNICTVFNDSDIEEVLLTYMTILQDIDKNTNIDLNNTYSLFLTLVIRQFSDVPISESNDVTDLVKISKVLLNNKITQAVYKQFPKEQLDYLNDRAKEASESLKTLVENAMNKQEIE